MSFLAKLLPECRVLGRTLGTVQIRKSFATTVQEDIPEVLNKKMSKAMRAYLERSQKYNDFMKKEQDAFEIGKRHLANMMGYDPESITQEQIDESIEYLFPSGLFEKKARPFLKPPHLVFPPKKDAEFDETGRPYHFLFYTGKPNFYNYLHVAYENLEKINNMENIKNVNTLPEVTEPLDLTGSEWYTKEELENIVVEQLNYYEYTNYINILERLATHKNSFVVKEFIMRNRKLLLQQHMTFQPTEPLTDANGRKYVLTKDCPRKSARADVKVIYPGTGSISINGEGIEYFRIIESRNQVLFPLELTGLQDGVDIEATVHGGGETSQAGAIRWGISWGLRCFVSPDLFETLRIAGLLQKDYRHKERKKPGQAGARKKFTWKKR